MTRYILPPRLPVPTLSESLARFIRAMKPLLTDNQLDETIRSTKNFEENEGSYLHGKLLKISEETDNWASQTFIQGNYLYNRSPLVISNAPSPVQTRFQWANRGEKLATISRYLVYLLNKMEDIRNERLPQDMVRKTPICMEQYKNILGMHRLAYPTLDKYLHSPDSKHIVVMHEGNIYKMPVFTSEDREMVSREQIEEMLSQVLEDSGRAELGRTRSVGLLTVLYRDAWYLAREEMMLSPVNAASLGAIEQSLFGLSIDGSDVEDLAGALKLTRFGDPRDNFSYYNRWFGLGLQTIFTDKGYLGWSLEHSMCDGSILSLFENVLSECLLGEHASPASDPKLKVELLKWELSHNVKANLEKIKAQLAHLYQQYDVYNLEFSEFGKDDIKKQGINFQTFINIAIQLAYFKLYRRLDHCYQHVSLRFFRGGRLEQPHVTTSESKEFVEEMNMRNLSNEEKLMLLKSAMRKHKEILTDASKGQAYVKHIQALKLLAEKEGLSAEFFQTESYEIFSLPKLCAPFIVSKLPVIGTFPIPKGAGHCVTFHPIKRTILFSVCTILKSPSTIPSSEFSNALESSLRELKRLI